MRRIFLTLFLTSGLIALGIYALCRDVHGPLRSEAYVWQLGWTDSVRESIVDETGDFAGLTVLGAEVGWDLGSPKVNTAHIDWAILSRRDIPITLAFGVASTRDSEWDEVFAALSENARSQLESAAQNGVSIRGLHIDFDASERQLGRYAETLHSLRATWDDKCARSKCSVPLSVTVLPAWLRAHDFPKLLSELDEYVLQVHSLGNPRQDPDRYAVINAKLALTAIGRAGRLGKPFRVALPTYGYMLALDKSGKFLGISAESASPYWPAEARMKLALADPNEVAEVVRSLEKSHPRLLRGLIWYRLPVRDDSLNWSAATLHSVIAGEPVAPELSAVLRDGDAKGAYDVLLTNAGNAPLHARPRVALSWRPGARIFADGLNAFHYRANVDASSAVFLGEERKEVFLRPHESMIVGWIRTNERERPHLEIQ